MEYLSKYLETQEQLAIDEEQLNLIDDCRRAKVASDLAAISIAKHLKELPQYNDDCEIIEPTIESRISELSLSELCELIDDVYCHMPSKFEIMRPIFNAELEKRGLEALLDKERNE